jgi:hypothetical protein
MVCKIVATVEVIRLPQGRSIVGFYILRQEADFGRIRYDRIMTLDRCYLPEDGDCADRLFRFLNALGRDVEIRVVPNLEADKRSQTRVVSA